MRNYFLSRTLHQSCRRPLIDQNQYDSRNDSGSRNNIPKSLNHIPLLLKFKIGH